MAFVAPMIVAEENGKKKARCVRKQDPRRGLSGSATSAACLSQSWASRMFGRRAHVEAAHFALLFEDWAMRISTEANERGSKMREEAGSTPGAPRGRDDCLLFLSFLDESISFARCVRVEAPVFSLWVVGHKHCWRRK